MDEQSGDMKLWKNESKTTQKVFTRIPEAWDYRPDAKSRTAREIAWQIVCEEQMIMDALEGGARPPGSSPRSDHDERAAGRQRETPRRHNPTLQGVAGGQIEGRDGVLRHPAPSVGHGVELSLRHRAPSRADIDLPSPDGVDGSPDHGPSGDEP
jgi:hypothetical protein